MPLKILIIDDEEEMCLSLSEIFSARKYSVLTATDPLDVLPLLEKETADLILMDVRMPGLGGVSLLKMIREIYPETGIIMMSGYASTENIVQCMKYGAINFYEKPLNIPELINEAEEYLNKHSSSALEAHDSDELVSETKAMKDIFQIIRTAAPTDAPVIITGESGTGKERIANGVHSFSQRSSGPYVKLNCAAIPDSLLESELFGHAEGAFTDARRNREGKFEVAHGGTLFLDEIGDMSLNTQAKLLRVLQEKEFERLGSNELIKADIRIVAATNKNIPEMIKNGDFREDLFYRISVINIHLPPLRDRKKDIPLLCESFLKLFSSSYGKDVKELSPEVKEMFLAHDWPGNIRELKNVIERSVIFCQSGTVAKENLPKQYREMNIPVLKGEEKPLEALYQDLSRQAISDALVRAGGSKSKAADLLGIHRKTLYNRMKKYGLS
ncbi:MAG: sigma-54 dependent transcriptional regulator [Spirochaetales bacterium]|nr:sigma-54 dependent transcriptional regulator [Spirochaetales bacterium]